MTIPLAAASGSVVPLSAPVETTAWFARALGIGHDSRTVFAATTDGVEAFQRSGSSLVPVSGFTGSALRAPLVVR